MGRGENKRIKRLNGEIWGWERRGEFYRGLWCSSWKKCDEVMVYGELVRW